MSQLRKENFNLKLRIYFLEEKTPSAALSAGSESLYKQNVDLKVSLLIFVYMNRFDRIIKLYYTVRTTILRAPLTWPTHIRLKYDYQLMLEGLLCFL